jgi:hypothetical protein
MLVVTRAMRDCTVMIESYDSWCFIAIRAENRMANFELCRRFCSL